MDKKRIAAFIVLLGIIVTISSCAKPDQETSLLPVESVDSVATSPSESVLPLQIVMDRVEGRPGEQVELTIRVQNNPGLVSIKLALRYDSALKLVNVRFADDVAARALCSQPPAQQPMLLNWIDPTAQLGKEFQFAVLVFQIRQTAQEGDYPILISYDPEDIFMTGAVNVPVTLLTGTVKITG